MPNIRASRLFQVGDRVRISSSSMYYRTQPHGRNVSFQHAHERDAVGVITSIGSISSIAVRWDELAYSNTYSTDDLILAEAVEPTLFRDHIFALVVKVGGGFEFMKVKFYGEHSPDALCRFIKNKKAAYREATVLLMTKEEIKGVCDRILDVVSKDVRGELDSTSIQV